VDAAASSREPQHATLAVDAAGRGYVKWIETTDTGKNVRMSRTSR
jgi:hypothetical protein